MSSLPDILDAIADALDAVMGTEQLGDRAVQVVPIVNLNPQTPTSIDIYPATPFRGNETAGMGDIAGEISFVIRARVTFNDGDAAQEQLLSFLDDTNNLSVAKALEADPTLGGVVSEIWVEQHNGVQVFTDPPGEMLGCSWLAKVIA